MRLGITTNKDVGIKKERKRKLIQKKGVWFQMELKSRLSPFRVSDKKTARSKGADKPTHQGRPAHDNSFFVFL
jgi:hypothetical protein